jgi:hypothetical protein
MGDSEDGWSVVDVNSDCAVSEAGGDAHPAEPRRFFEEVKPAEQPKEESSQESSRELASQADSVAVKQEAVTDGSPKRIVRVHDDVSEAADASECAKARHEAFDFDYLHESVPEGDMCEEAESNSRYESPRRAGTLSNVSCSSASAANEEAEGEGNITDTSSEFVAEMDDQSVTSKLSITSVASLSVSFASEPRHASSESGTLQPSGT